MRGLGVGPEIWTDRLHLDASLRLAHTLVAAGKLKRGSEAREFLVLCAGHREQIPNEFWNVSCTEEAATEVPMRGVVLLAAAGVRANPRLEDLPESLAAVRNEPPPRVWRFVWSAVKEGGRFVPAMMGLALFLSAVGTAFEALLFRSLFELTPHLQLMGERVAAIAAIMAFLAGLLAEGKLEEALMACREALRSAEESEGPASPDVANLLNDLAEIENERQNFRGALALAERARAIGESWCDHFNGEAAAQIRGKTLELLGLLRCKLGDYASAEEALKGAAAIATAVFGEASEQAAGAQNNLGLLYKYWGRFDEGLRLYGLALRSIDALRGEESLASGVVWHNMGGILHARGDFAAAEEPARKAWEISRRLLGEDDPRTMLDAAAYAGILDGLGRYEESKLIYLRALAIFEKALGPQHYEIAANLHNLAAVHAARGHIDEAEEHYRRALALKEKLLGAESPDAALTRNNLGRLMISAGRPREAIPLLKSAVAVLEKQLPRQHPHLASAHANLEKAICLSQPGP